MEQDKSQQTSIDLEELDSKLFDCADVLRGSVDKGRYKDFILPLVFYSAVDSWYDQELNNKARDRDDKPFAELNETKKSLYRSEVANSFGLRIPEEYRWEDIVNTEDQIALEIDNALAEFEDQNKEYSGIFHNEFSNIDSFTGKEGDQLLRQLLMELDSISMKEIPPDMMGEAYMDLVKNFSDAEAGEYFTPPKIVRSMVQILEPFEKGSRFHDPTVGSGGMLVEVAEQIRAQYGDEFDDPDDLERFVDLEFEFTGQERNPTIAGIARMNLILHGLQNGEIKRGDSLTNPRFTENNQLRQFDYILANFPFSENGWKSGTEERQDEYGDIDWAEDGKLPHGNYGDFAFIMHMESHLADDGQLATVIPHGVLFRNGDQKYREYMIEQDMVEAVVGLPENLFEATGIPSGILVLNKDKPEKREGEVLFINADQEDEFYNDTGSDRVEILEEGIDKMKELYESWGDVERTARVVDTDEIEENEYNMNIALYVDTTEPQEDISVTETLQDIQDIENEYNQLQSQLNTYMNQLNYQGDNNE